MTIRIVKPGLQTTVQAGPRTGQRHLGVPASGAADPLSLALANRLVGNTLLAPALETTLTGVSVRFERNCFAAVTGAKARVWLNGERVKRHRTLAVAAGDELEIGPAKAGARNYLAFAGGVDVAEVLGSASTYLPAGFGGFQGRAVRAGDVLSVAPVHDAPEMLTTPRDFRPLAGTSWALRACYGAEVDCLDKDSRFDLFDTNFSVGNRADRMGLQLEGARFDVKSRGRLASAPVFPGTIQCPEDGRPFLLSIDAQTIGGYPRVAQVARADRHLIGQLRPGDHVRLLWRDTESAREELLAKHDYWREWLPGIRTII
ncbi:MAG TPA: biotin-dependent carboxyltransferase family protein [Woeseiaceae bacterium]|nr:biotin-dependent carboxyltransferase family protein [Woeseiaceae bacterium]